MRECEYKNHRIFIIRCIDKGIIPVRVRLKSEGSRLSKRANTYFSFQNKFYEQVEGAVMGSLVSPTVANLYMEHFVREALWSASNSPCFG